jgi:uncharacterized protein (TIRG00374 family)
MSGFFKKNRKLIWVMMWIAASYLLYLIFKDIDWSAAWQHIKDSLIGWLLMACLFNVLVQVFWVSQWRAFLPEQHDVPFLRMFELTSLTSLAMNTIPFGGGHALGVVMLAKQDRVGHAIALSVLALDQIAEAFAKITLFTMVALFTPIPEAMKTAILWFLLVGTIFFSVLMFFAFRHRDHKDPHEDEEHDLSAKIRHFISKWAHNLEPIRNVRTFPFGVLMAWGMKLMEGLGIWAVQKAFGLDLPIWTVCVTLAAVNLATMLPVAPGNLGVFEAAVFFIYQFFGLSPEIAMGLAIVQHLCYLLPKIVLGYGILIYRNFYPVSSLAFPDPDET